MKSHSHFPVDISSLPDYDSKLNLNVHYKVNSPAGLLINKLKLKDIIGGRGSWTCVIAKLATHHVPFFRLKTIKQKIQVWWPTRHTILSSTACHTKCMVPPWAGMIWCILRVMHLEEMHLEECDCSDVSRLSHRCEFCWFGRNFNQSRWRPLTSFFLGT